MSIFRTLILILSIFLILVLPFIQSKLGIFLGSAFYMPVHGNFEFTKVIFFNIVSSIIILFYIFYIYFTPQKKQKIKVPKIIFFFYTILIISTFFALSQSTSLFGTPSKAHSFLMWNNLIGLFYIFVSNIKKVHYKSIENILIVSGIFVSIFGLWQMFFPSFDYGELSNRLLGSFGHPNYLALYVLLIIPLVYEKYFKTKNSLFSIIFFLFCITIFLTKSIVAIFILFSYFFYLFYKKQKHKSDLNSYILTYIGVLILLGVGVLHLYPEKIPSFLSRFYIWETTIKIIFSDIKIFLFGIGFENLPLLFDNFKSIELYIFENIGYKADRPHNIILNFWVHLGIGGLVFIGSIYYYIINNLFGGKWYNISLFLGSFFLLFHFASIASYLIIIILFVFSIQNNSHFGSIAKEKILISIIGFISFFSLYTSISFYQSELFFYKKEYQKAAQTFPHYSGYFYKIGESKIGLEKEGFASEKYYLSEVYKGQDIPNGCRKLIEYHPTIENYFYCGTLLEKFGHTQQAYSYYEVGIKRLPDLWNTTSIYYNNYFIKNFSSLGRFMSPKYSDLENILEKIKEK